MPHEINNSELPPFPKRIPEKLKAIRERLGLTPDEIAPKVGAKTGAEVTTYENDEDDPSVNTQKRPFMNTAKPAIEK